MAVRTWIGTDTGNEGDWATAANWLEGSVPVTGDEVYIRAGSNAITAGLNQSAVTLDWFEIEDGYNQNIGTKAGYLRVAIGANAILSPTGGAQFLDFGSSNYSVDVRKSGSAATGQRAINIIGSNLATLSVQSGSVGIASDPAKTSTLATLRIYGGSVWIGQGVTFTTGNILGGSAIIDCAATTLNLIGGTLETRYTGALTTANIYDGTFYSSSAGTLTTLNHYGGTVDTRRSGIARTITTYNALANQNARLFVDPAAVTITNFNRPSVVYSASFQVGA